MAVTASGLELTWARPVILARGRHRLYRCTCEITFHHSVPPCRTEGSGSWFLCVDHVRCEGDFAGRML